MRLRASALQCPLPLRRPDQAHMVALLRFHRVAAAEARVGAAPLDAEAVALDAPGADVVELDHAAVERAQAALESCDRADLAARTEPPDVAFEAADAARIAAEFAGARLDLGPREHRGGGGS